MRKPIFSLIAISALCCPLAAHAAGMMKPGLWEMTIKSGGGAASQIPPEKLEELRKRGINIPGAGGAPIKTCVSKEMAEREHPAIMSRSGPMSDCQIKNPQHSGNTYTAEMVCSGPTMQGQGSTKGTFGSDSYTYVSDFTGTARGRPMNTHTEASGKWLGSDCGSVQPPVMPKPK
jgi:Protein of unknown function (DUF3617)